MVPATCVGTVVLLPPCVAEMINPAVAKLMAQLLAAEQAVPFGQHLRGLAATIDSPDSVTVDTAPLVAAGQVSVVLATPLALNVRAVEASVPDEAASVAVAPDTTVAALVQGLLASAQAVTVAVLEVQLTPLDGSDSS